MAKKIVKKAPKSVIHDFERLTQQMRSSLATLEERVVSRTRDLEIAAEVSREVATTLVLSELLPRMVELTKKRFKLYHAQVFLLDADKKSLELAAGAGRPGRAMKNKGHSIPVDAPKSAIARAARTQKPVILNNAVKDEAYLPNPLLPKTQSEMALPMIIGADTIGVLDVQADTANRFEEDDVLVFSTLAGQMSVAVQNARVFQQVRDAERELSRVYTMSLDMLGSAGFDGYFKDLNPAWTEVLGYDLEELKAKPFIEFIHPDDRESTNAEAARISEGATALYFENRYLDKQGEWRWLSWNARPDVENELIYFVTRDITETKEATRRDTLAYELGQKLTTLLDPAELMRETVKELADSFGYYHAQVYLHDTPSKRLVLAEGLGEAGEALKKRGHSISIDAPRSLNAAAARSLKPVVANDVTRAPAYLPNPYLPFSRSEACIPLIVGKELIGVLDVQDRNVDHFRDQETQTLTIIANQLAVAISNARVYQDTAIRAAELATVSEVSTEASANLNLDDLLQRVADLVRDRFGLYHAQIYLANEAENSLRLAAGAGEAGRELASRRHAIAMDHPRSLVAEAARGRAAVIANDVFKNPHFMPNPYLNRTRSEMAVPMVVGDDLVGVLDVQSDVVNRFTERDRQIKTTLASQVAVAVVNARTFQEVQETQQELSRVYDMSLDMIGSAGFDGYFKDVNAAWRQIFGYSKEELLARPFIEFVHPEDREATNAETARIGEGATALYFENRYQTKNGEWRWLSWNARPDTESELIYFVTRDVTEKRKAEQRDALAFELGQKLTTLLDPTTLMRETVNALASTFGYYHAQVYLNDPLGNRLVLAEGLGEAGDALKKRSHSIRLDAPRSLNASAARTRKPVVANDVTRSPDYLPNPYLPRTRSEVCLPLVVGNDLMGVLDVQERERDHFSEQEVRTLSIIANQMAIAISNARVYQETELRAKELATVTEVGIEASTSQNPEELLQKVADLTKERFGLYHAHIYLLSDDGALLQLAAGAGEPGRIMARRKQIIPVNNQRSVVAQVARSREAVIINDVKSAEAHLPNPLLPETRSEMAIPMIVGEDLLGVLDVQADTVNRFTEHDRQIKTTLASQIATAVANARLLAQVQLRAEELATVTEVSIEASTSQNPEELLQKVADLTKERFGLYHAHVYLLSDDGALLQLAAGAGEPGRIMTRRKQTIPVSHLRSLVARAARERQAVIVNDVKGSQDHLPNPLLPETRSEMAIPMIVGETLIGVLDVQSAVVNRFSDNDRQIQTTLASQIAVSVANSRLLSQVERRARELATVAEVSAEASATLDPAELLQSVADLTKERFGLYHAHVYLLSSDGALLQLAAGAGEAGRTMVRRQQTIPIANQRSLVALAAREREAVIVNDVKASEAHLPNPLLPNTRSEMAIPMIVGENLIGVLDVQADTVNRFTEEDRQVKTTLASQIAIAIANAHLLQQTQAALSLTEALYAGSEKIIQSTTVDDVLVALVGMSELGQFDQVDITLFDQDWGDEPPSMVYVAAAWPQPSASRGFPVGAEYPPSQFPALGFVSREHPTLLADTQIDPRVDERARAVLQQIGMRSLGAFPLVTGEHWFGVITAQKAEPLELREQDIRQLSALIGQAASVVYTIRLLEDAQETAEQLRELDRLKNEFLANMSHELRTPLNSIIGYSELLIDGIGPDIDEMSREDLKGIHSSGQYLLSIINDILDLAKIEAGRMELSRAELNLAEVAPTVMEAARVLLRDKPDVELVTDLPADLPSVNADAVRLRQIMFNLLSNAIKFTERGHVRLFAQQNNGSIEIGVEDTGIGIDEAHRELVFEQFRQADGSATRRAGGTGLGLAITRHLVRMHGGEIDLRSEVGRGSVFTFTLPLLPASPGNRASGSGSGAPRDGVRVEQPEATGD